VGKAGATCCTVAVAEAMMLVKLDDETSEGLERELELKIKLGELVEIPFSW